MTLHALGQGIWETSGALRIIGLNLGHRMTVVRLQSGGLFGPLAWPWTKGWKTNWRPCGGPTIGCDGLLLTARLESVLQAPSSPAAGPPGS